MAAFDLKYIQIHGHIDDVSTASAEYHYVTKDMEGELIEIGTVLGGAIGTADADVTVSVNGTSAGVVTIATASSAEGDVDTADLTGNYVKEGDYIKVETDGASTNAVPVGYTIEIKR